MRHFLKPTRVTWLTLALLFIVNAASVLFGNTYPLFLQLLWIYGPVFHLGINVSNGGYFSPVPNSLGLLFILLALLIDLALYYLIACAVSSLLTRDAAGSAEIETNP
jgi:hypothetical protein